MMLLAEYRPTCASSTRRRLASDRLPQFYVTLRHAEGCSNRSAGIETTNEDVAQASGTTAPECRFGAGS